MSPDAGLDIAITVLAFATALLLLALTPPPRPPTRPHRAATTRTLSLRALRDADAAWRDSLPALHLEPDTDELDEPCRLSTCPHRALTNLPSASAWQAMSPSPASPSANAKRLLRGSPPEA